MTAYRRQIDGLRAVAGLPVILFHAGFAAFSGGFVGVDVFFVIAGYLITSLVLAELGRSLDSIAAEAPRTRVVVIGSIPKWYPSCPAIPAWSSCR